MVLQRPVCAQILVQLSSILQNLLGRLFNIRQLLKNVSRVILLNVFRGEADKGFQVFKLLVALTVIYIQRCNLVMLQRCNLVMLSIARNTD